VSEKNNIGGIWNSRLEASELAFELQRCVINLSDASAIFKKDGYAFCAYVQERFLLPPIYKLSLLLICYWTLA